MFDPKLYGRRNSKTILRTMQLRIGQRRPEDEMLKCYIYIFRVPYTHPEVR
ncbi:hypothetical protein PITCH_A1040013 [uncultured Desulfobacterium sp.]|uniref:Transposase n=1 Tax=uncultured Desulfobacterium sp. TaxID=201089 RepID=A0A445MQV9_9BACT|nr:hypothetical protein PITCH_A1040013 [uncultured Desulfobacterium sp.]